MKGGRPCKTTVSIGHFCGWLALDLLGASEELPTIHAELFWKCGPGASCIGVPLTVLFMQIHGPLPPRPLNQNVWRGGTRILY